ncbi:MAG: hypothetical protein GY724_20540 [Actinomycetia bacterium]|nr:hypothetical protein [Actinomycetes bacterium]MCP4223486.1 hypothetical protein [Actinomycetes bacterium]MCP5032846.1 hypothetical protein [Actinomycetes bacterium]
MSSVTMSAAQLGRSYRSASRRASEHPACILIFDQLDIRTEIQLRSRPSKLGEFDSRPVLMPSHLAFQLDTLAGPQLAPIQLAQSNRQVSEPARFSMRSSSLG